MAEHDGNWFNVTCETCGKKFHLKPSHIPISKTHHCSKECFRKAKMESMKGKGNHQYGLRGEKNASWKGERKFTNYGYISVYSPDHPFCTKAHHVFEHRLVAEKYLLTEENSVEINGKRYLKPEYDVHHKDFDRTNNDVSNLAVMLKSDHKRLHLSLNKRAQDKKTGRFIKKTVLFKKVKETAKIPECATEDSAGYDMFAELSEPVTIAPHSGIMIRSGVALAIPKGYAGFVFARSGLATRCGLRPATCVSVIDADYRGEVGLPVFNDSDEPRVISPHDRIAQMVFMPILKPKVEIVESLDGKTERGENGFGSTGR